MKLRIGTKKQIGMMMKTRMKNEVDSVTPADFSISRYVSIGAEF